MKSFTRNHSRRSFLKSLSAGTLGAGALGLAGCSQAKFAAGQRDVTRTGPSRVGFVPSPDQREGAYQALKPFASEVENAIGDKQVVIKANLGQVRPDWWLNATDANQLRGILDFLGEIHDRPVIIAESTAAGGTSTHVGFENYGYLPLADEYDVSFVDLNEQTYTTKWIYDEMRHPMPVNIIDTYLDPDVYLISATRLKTHNCVLATLSLKNVVMGSPVHHFRQASREGRNEKQFMHQGTGTWRNKGLTINMYQIARAGVVPNLAVLDGVVGMEGNGPVTGTPIEQGVSLASTDWLAADRLGVELMGIDYSWCKYLQWCGESGMGNDNLDELQVIGPDYRPHITQYRLHENVEEQKEWVAIEYDMA